MRRQIAESTQDTTCAQEKSKRYLWGLLISLVAIIDSVAIYWMGWTIGLGVDWIVYFRPAVIQLLAGHSPYSVHLVFNPPWTFLFMLPLALLPKTISLGIYILIAVSSYLFILRRLKASPLQTLAFFLCPAVIYDLGVTNLTWFAALGLVMPPQIGLFFVLAKPQLGLPVAIFWMVEATRKGGLRQAFITFAPVTAAYLLSFLAYGPYLLGSSANIPTTVNVAFWPLAIPLGLVLEYIAIRSRKIGYAVIASPFLTPYIALHGWAYALLGLMTLPAESIIALLSFWVFIFLRGGWKGL
jgi:hypothetical protein